MKVIICKGLPASGKSTWAKEFVKENKGAVRINKDDLREMLHGGEWNSKNENLVVATRDILIREYMFKGLDTIIIDDTNFCPKHEKQIRDVVDDFNSLNVLTQYQIEVKFFDTPLEECLKRDAKREKSVGKDVILKMWNQYLKPKPVEIIKGLPDAIICDLDGTLAILNGRHPYDASTCYDDLVCNPIRNILDEFSDISFKHQLIFVSGREDKYIEQTYKWIIYKANLQYDFSLFMRKTGDNRDDTIVKREIYENEIKGKYNVSFVFDDRPKVVRMWKNLGLFVFNVGDGYEF